MAKEYLDRLEAMLGPAIRAHDGQATIEIKHFFSGAAAYAEGRICITLTPVGLAMKLPEASRARLLKAGAKALRYFPKAPIKKDYVVLPPRIRDDRPKLKYWAGRSFTHALTLPRPKRK